MVPSLSRLNSAFRPILVSLSLALSTTAPKAVSAAPMSSLDLGNREQYATAFVGSRLLIAGGEQFVHGPEYPYGSAITDSDEVDLFDGDSGEWSIARLAVPRSGMSVAIVGSQVLFAGGYDHDPETGANRSSAAVDMYDSPTDLWSTATLSEPRDRMAVAVVGTLVLFAGGGSFPITGFSSTVDIYDSADGSWSEANLSQGQATYMPPDVPLVTSVRPPGLAPLTAWTVGSKVLFVERSIGQPSGWNVDVFDAETGDWVNHDPGLDEISHVVVSGEHAILVGTSASTPTAIVYDATNGDWVTFAVTSPHFGGAAGTVSNDVVLAGGSLGLNSDCARTDAVDLYDVTTGSWTSARLSEGRAGGIATIEAGGRLLFAGGVTCSGVSSQVDIYDGATDKWSSATLSQARTAITAVNAGPLAIFAGGLRPHDSWRYGEATDAVDVYNTDTGRWTASHLAEPRIAIAPAISGSEVLLAGGERPPTADRQPYVASAMIDVFETDAQSWTTDSLSAGRAGALVANLGSQVAFVGGHLDCAGCGVQSLAVIDVFGHTN